MSHPLPRAEAEARIAIVPCADPVRAVFNGETVAASDRALVLRERGYPPRVYFPPTDARMALLTPTARRTHCPFKGDASYWTLAAGGRTLETAAWAYPDPLPGVAEIAGHLSFVDAVEIEPAPDPA
ncbi:MAG: DUF427 domain-containing protein [Kiloniellaceae bacterium]